MQTATLAPALQQVTRLLNENKQAEASQIVKEYLRLNPSDPDGWYVASFVLNGTDKQVTALQRAIKLAPQHAQAQARLATLCPPPIAPDVQATPNSPSERVKPAREQILDKLQAIRSDPMVPKDASGRTIVTGLDMSGLDLIDLYLSELSLVRVNFAGAILNDASFNSCDLSYANFSGARMGSVSLGRSIFDYANMQGIELSSNGDPTDASFVGTDFTGAYFGYIDFSRAKAFSPVSVRGATYDFDRCTFPAGYDADALGAAAVRWIGDKRVRMDDAEGRLTAYNEAIRSANGSDKLYDYYIQRGMLLERRGENEKALTDYTAAIQFRPQYDRAYTRRGNVYTNLNQPDLALADYNLRLSTDTMSHNAETYFGRGVTWSQKGQWQRAIADLTDAIRLDPTHAMAYFRRALIYSTLEDNANMMRDLDACIQAEPGLADAYYHRGLALAMSGDSANAIRDFEQHIRLHGQNAQDAAEMLESLQAETNPNIRAVSGSVDFSSGSLGPFALIGLPILVFVIVLVASAASTPSFLSLNNIHGMVFTASYLGLMVIGMTLVMMTRGLDLSVASVMILSGMIAGQVYKDPDSLPYCMAAAVISGLVIGTIQGFIITRFALPSALVTFTGLAICQGVTLGISQGTNVPMNFGETISRNVAGIPVMFIILIAILVITQGLLSVTPLGRNLRAAGVSGSTHGVSRTVAYALSGGLAGLAGILMVVRIGAAIPSGAGMEYQVIAAAIVGGASLSGGAGNAIGAVIGTFILVMISYLMMLNNIGSQWSLAITGAVAIIAAVINQTIARILERRRGYRDLDSVTAQPDGQTTAHYRPDGNVSPIPPQAGSSFAPQPGSQSLIAFVLHYWLAYFWISIALAELVIAAGILLTNRSAGSSGNLSLAQGITGNLICFASLAIVIAFYKALRRGARLANESRNFTDKLAIWAIQLVFNAVAFPFMELFFELRFLHKARKAWNQGAILVNDKNKPIRCV